MPKKPLTALDLFSGIGGFALGLGWAGFETVAFCESNDYCRQVLNKHWPGVPVYGDVAKLCRRLYDCEPLNEDDEAMCPRCGVDFGECDCIGTDQFLDLHGQPDVICGGFPCQDIADLGPKTGVDGERSGLWREGLRIVSELEPRAVILENVPALRRRGLGVLLGHLAEVGYCAEWHCIPAAYIGASHRRDRIWIVAFPEREGLEGLARYGEAIRQAFAHRPVSPQGLRRGEHPSGWWHVEPSVGRVADGVPRRVDRIRALGNSVVPQVVEVVGRAVAAALNG